MKTILPQTKRYHGLDYRLEKSCQKAAIYSVRKPRGRDLPSGLLVSYEVFRVRFRPPRVHNINGKTVEFKGGIQWPHSEAFGKWAWCYMTWEKALSGYNRLAKQ